MGKLSVLRIKALVDPGRYGDGDGLYLLVKPSNKKTWIFRYMVDGRAREMGLGPFPLVSLADARLEAIDARSLLRKGGDPIDARQASKRKPETRTFRQATLELIEDKRSGWRSAKHAWQWTATLERHAFPRLGDKPVSAITTEDVMAVLRPIWPETPETASRIRGRIEAVIDAARARGWCTGENPARWKGHLSTRLPAPSRVRPVEHYPSLPYDQVGQFMAALRDQVGIAPRALEMTILTVSRAGMVRGMTWSEVDLDRAVWLVPGKRMKGGKPHRVPLSAGALAVLDAVRPDHQRQDSIVFPGMTGKALSLMSMTMCVRRMNGDRDPEATATWRDEMTGEPIVPHGFRSTFRVWAGEMTPYPREVVEAALAHVVAGKVERTYARTDLLEKRRPLMEEWSVFAGGRAIGIRQAVDVGPQAVRQDEGPASELLRPDAALADQLEQARAADPG